MIHDSAVASLGDVVIQLQLEPIIFAFGDDVPGLMRIEAGERAVGDAPTRCNPFMMKVMPTREVGAVEQ